MAATPGLSSKVLSSQLKEMESDGLVARIAAETGKTSLYCLTPLSESLIPVLQTMAEWGLRNLYPGFVRIEDCQ